MTWKQTERWRGLVALLALASLPLWVASANAVILDGTNRCDVKLADGTDVTLFGEFVSAIKPRGDEEPVAGTGAPLTPGRGLGLSDATLAPTYVSTRRGDRNPRQRVGRNDNLSAERVDRMPRQGRNRDDRSPRQRPREEPEREVRCAPGDLRCEADRRQRQARDRLEGMKDGKNAMQERELSNRYYYLPPQKSLRISKREDGTPKFLFVRYTSDEKDGAQGGIMHFLMEWSLSTDQEEKLRRKVEAQCRASGKPGVLGGVADLDEDGGPGSFRVTSAILEDANMKRSLVSSGRAPTMPGGQIAVASSLSKEGAQLLLATVEKSKSIADLSVALDLSYVVQLPAARGRIVFHWDRFQQRQESLTDTDAEGCWNALFFVAGCHFTDAEISSVFDTMIEEGEVEFDFEGYQPDDEYSQKVMEAMLQFFTDAMMEPAPPADFDLDLDDPEGFDVDEEELDAQGRPRAFGFVYSGNSYTISRDRLASAYASKKQIINMRANLPIRRSLQLVGNLASWYKSVEDNENCVQEVNLSDPFFERRDVRFIVDLDAKEIFEDMINYVTINVKKERDSGNIFERSVTIDQDYLRKEGVQASVTYAREGDDDSEEYLYQAQWSVRGGNLYTQKANGSRSGRGGWHKGKWEGVTLSPPIERWYVEVEGDLDQMEANDIARVTAEIHYPLFKKEQSEIVPLSPRGGEWMVGRNIYVDRGTRGFVYRLIVHHKKDGRIVLPWSSRVGDRYVYATIPEEFLDGGSLYEQGREAAKQLGRLGAEQVLDKFKEVFATAD